MIYHPYDFIKLFQQSDSLKKKEINEREGERGREREGGKGRRVQIRYHIDESSKRGRIQKNSERGRQK